MKIYEVVDELTERGQGADGAAELQKRRTDPMSPQNKLKKPPAPPKPQKQHQQHVQFKPAQYRDPLNLGKYKGAMNR